jgi:N-acetylglucosaminylphosphatidylinositol deacetylase
MSDKTLSVLVIAHPDDESMFFVPTIVGMKNEGAPLWLLCLTTGNFDGLGKIRSKELVRTGTDVLGFDKIILCDDDKVKDHPTNGWNIRHAASLIERNLLAAFKEISDNYAGIELITFDQRGVSGHVNHRDTYFACRSLWQGSCETRATPKNIPVLPPVSMWTLSTNTVPVYRSMPGFSFVSPGAASCNSRRARGEAMNSADIDCKIRVSTGVPWLRMPPSSSGIAAYSSPSVAIRI